MEREGKDLETSFTQLQWLQLLLAPPWRASLARTAHMFLEILRISLYKVVLRRLETPAVKSASY